jgi:hypothetical protein
VLRACGASAGAQHFAQGAYSPGDEHKISACRPYNASAAALAKHKGETGDLNYRSALATREAVARLPSRRRVAVLPFFAESARRFNMHIGGKPSCKEGKRCSVMADCLHWCPYSSNLNSQSTRTRTPQPTRTRTPTQPYHEPYNPNPDLDPTKTLTPNPDPNPGATRRNSSTTVFSRLSSTACGVPTVRGRAQSGPLRRLRAAPPRAPPIRTRARGADACRRRVLNVGEALAWASTTTTG